MASERLMYMYMYMYMYIHVYVRTYMYMYMYIHVHVLTYLSRVVVVELDLVALSIDGGNIVCEVGEGKVGKLPWDGIGWGGKL